MKAEYIDHMGSDLSVVNAARVSFDKTSEWDIKTDIDEVEGQVIHAKVLSDRDAKLIRYLAKYNHWTPFAHTAITLRMKAPIPIRTQCFKHKFGLVENEESRRYIASTPDLFVPVEFRLKPEGSAKQGSAGVHPQSEDWLTIYEDHCRDGIELYEAMINDGIAPEQARFVLPQGVEVQWIWTGSLAAFARFYNQRTDPHAQKESQDLATEVGKIIEPLFPVAWTALTTKE